MTSTFLGASCRYLIWSQTNPIRPLISLNYTFSHHPISPFRVPNFRTKLQLPNSILLVTHGITTPSIEMLTANHKLTHTENRRSSLQDPGYRDQALFTKVSRAIN
ncbi:hypothetical protein CC2G_003748 [Coprinopsis cinerea AmutBmut pab1-1]|nr:hypothetical protein CC2G_003748 [Coprinopsis cinerea AmutBmut pab1-1]